MGRSANVLIIGLGAMGSAAAAWLAERGQRVVAFDAFTPPHAQGSSHGRSRIYRYAYWEDPRYVHLLLRGRELWRKLERDSRVPLLHRTGGLVIGPSDGQLVPRSAESARQFDLPYEVLMAVELQRRWPVFAIAPHMMGLLEQDAGYLIPELCIAQWMRVAHHHGAELHCNEPVISWEARGDAVTVRTSRGIWSADRLIVAAGPWAPRILRDLGLPLRVTRQVVFWFRPQGGVDAFRPDRLPIYLFESEPAMAVLYGFPLTGGDEEGVKVALHGSDDVCTPESCDRAIHTVDEKRIRARLATTVPSLAGRLVDAATCLYTMTPDEHFIVGAHPEHANVLVAAGFSGHGFKFAPVIGEALGELAVKGASSVDLSMFAPGRFR